MAHFHHAQLARESAVGCSMSRDGLDTADTALFSRLNGDLPGFPCACWFRSGEPKLLDIPTFKGF